MLNPCASVRFVSYKCQQGVFHHFGAELPSNTSLEVQSQSCAKKNDSCGCFTRHSPAFWNLEKSCVENTLISNATRPTWDQSHGPQLPRGIIRNISGQGVENGFLAIHQLHLQTRLLFLAQGTARRAHPPYQLGKNGYTRLEMYPPQVLINLVVSQFTYTLGDPCAGP